MGEAKKRGSYEERLKTAKKERPLGLYRYFSKPEHAIDFANGKVRISTLTACRGYSDPQQGDKGEGSSIFGFNGVINNKSELGKFEKEFQKLGVEFRNEDDDCVFNNIVIQDVKSHTQIRDAYILCLTTDPASLVKQSPEWKYGVKINLQPKILALALCRAFNRQHILEKGSLRYGYGPVDYDTPRYYEALENEPKNLAFLKPEEHKPQQEYRIGWQAKSDIHSYEPVFLECPELRPHLKLLF